VTASSLGSLLDDVKKELTASDFALNIKELPGLPDIYPHFTRETISEPFESIKIPARDTFVGGTVMYIHSSGSTGFPKPIAWTHEVFSKYTFSPFIDPIKRLDKDTRESLILGPCLSSH
jgi:acyl-coenzyme A synthetase/AMP-(fatty) acid ligase